MTYAYLYLIQHAQISSFAIRDTAPCMHRDILARGHVRGDGCAYHTEE